MTKRISVEQMPEVKNEEQMRHLVRYVNFIHNWQEKCHIFSVAYELPQITY